MTIKFSIENGRGNEHLSFGYLLLIVCTYGIYCFIEHSAFCNVSLMGKSKMACLFTKNCAFCQLRPNFVDNLLKVF